MFSNSACLKKIHNTCTFVHILFIILKKNHLFQKQKSNTIVVSSKFMNAFFHGSVDPHCYV